MTFVENIIHTNPWGRVGEITLRRPQALNAHNTEMNNEIGTALQGYQHDDTIKHVILTGEGRAFCAGGDVRQLRQNVLSGDTGASYEFFRTEYAIDYLLATYPKPVVSVVNGIAFGGGCGFALHPKTTIVTNNAYFAMPETVIGLYPDAGSSYFLNQLPLPLARYYALTGTKITGQQAVSFGLAQEYIPSEQLAHRLEQLRTQPFTPPPESPVSFDTQLNCIGDTAEVIAALSQDPATRDTIAHASPTSLHIADRLLQLSRPDAQAGPEGLARCLARELELSLRVVRLPDFVEGVRARLVDKDNNAHFAPLKQLDEIFSAIETSLNPTLITEIEFTPHQQDP